MGVKFYEDYAQLKLLDIHDLSHSEYDPVEEAHGFVEYNVKGLIKLLLEKFGQ